MKKLLTFLLVGIMAVIGCFALTGCGKDKVVSEGDTIIVGVTDYAPMDYIDDATGTWTGFDAELATKVFTNLGFKVEFKEIDWDTKIVTLNAGTIDVIWNGMTVNDELLSNLLLTNVYLKNQQVAVLANDKLDTVTKIEDLVGKTVAVESGSAAEDALPEGANASKLTNQVTALLNVSTNQADVAIVDYALAKELTSEGGAYYGKLTMKNIGFEVENFSAAVRKSDSKLLWQINEQLALLEADGTIDALAEKYELVNQLPANFNK